MEDGALFHDSTRDVFVHASNCSGTELQLLDCAHELPVRCEGNLASVVCQGIHLLKDMPFNIDFLIANVYSFIN